MRRAVLVLALTLSGCSTQPSEEIRSGTYSGSTAADVGVTVAVGGSVIAVDGKKTDLVSVDDNRKFVVDKEPEQAPSFVDKSRWDCRPAFKGKELHCTVIWANGRSEAIELMKE